MGDENELGEDGSDEVGKKERTLLCRGGRLGLVEVVQYVGLTMNGDGRIEEEVRSRIRKKARVIIGVLNEPL